MAWLSGYLHRKPIPLTGGSDGAFAYFQLKLAMAFAALTNAITEVSVGMYTIASGLAQDERNADVSTLKFSALHLIIGMT